jgi:hypothetical protein
MAYATAVEAAFAHTCTGVAAIGAMDVVAWIRADARSEHSYTESCPGLTNSAHFVEIHQNLTDSGRSEFKNCKITAHCFKISEKDKKSAKKYIKKLDRILRLLVKKFL